MATHSSKQSKKNKALTIVMLNFLLFISFVYSSILLFFYLSQRSFIYFPESQFLAPSDVGIGDMQVVTLNTDDHLAIKAWYRAPTQKDKPTLVYFHGNAGNISRRSFIITPFLQVGYGVLLITYRGYSDNPGNPSEEGFYRDGRAAIQFLLNQHIPLECIALYGESIGTGVAVQMATEYPVGALILQSPFTSLVDIGKLHYPFLPIKLLMKDQFNSIKKVDAIHAPTLILYGQKDRLIPPRFSVQLYEALTTEKEIHPIPNHGHNGHYDPLFAIQFIEKHILCPVKQ